MLTVVCDMEKCDVCNASLSERTALKRHLLLVHKRSLIRRMSMSREATAAELQALMAKENERRRRSSLKRNQNGVSGVRAAAVYQTQLTLEPVSDVEDGLLDGLDSAVQLRETALATSATTLAPVTQELGGSSSSAVVQAPAPKPLMDLLDGLLQPATRAATSDLASFVATNPDVLARAVLGQNTNPGNLLDILEASRGPQLDDTAQASAAAASGVRAFCERLAMLFFQGGDPQSILQCVRQEVYDGLRLPGNADFYRSLVSVPPSAPLNLTT